jgi:hypothetical protein
MYAKLVCQTTGDAYSSNNFSILLSIPSNLQNLQTRQANPLSKRAFQIVGTTCRGKGHGYGAQRRGRTGELRVWGTGVGACGTPPRAGSVRKHRGGAAAQGELATTLARRHLENRAQRSSWWWARGGAARKRFTSGGAATE